MNDRHGEPPCPVLIVGAGPTGLTMALALARQGIACRIIDQATAPSEKSKALAIQARSLEIFEALGVVDTMLSMGLIIRGLALHAERRQIAHLSLEGIESRYNFILSLEQSETERILIAALTDLGVEVEWQHTLVDLRPKSDGVLVILKNHAGDEEQCRTAWVIGCDGAHSSVRYALGLAFRGGAYEDDFRLADLRLDWPLPGDRAHVFLRPEGPVGVIPLPGGYHRLVTIQAPDKAIQEPSLAYFQEQLASAAPKGTRAFDPIWLTSFRIHRRMTGSLRAGRIFLAGDAAHIHSPAGGQGMNTGLQDAFNLAWKLAMVIRCEARPTLLESYQDERLPVAEAVLRRTDIATRTARRRGQVAHHLRKAMIPLLLRSRRLQQKFANGLAGLSTSYAASPIVSQHAQGMRSGMRVPDLPLHDETGTSRRLFDVLDFRRYCLLFIDCGQLSEPDREGLLDLAKWAIQHRRPSLLVGWVIPASDVVPLSLEGLHLLVDTAGTIISMGAVAMLIRPDGYLAISCTLAELPTFKDFTMTLLAETQPTSKP